MRLKPLLLSISFVILWEVGVRVLGVPDFILPPPSAVFVEMWEVREELLRQSVPTLTEIWLGFAIAAGFGIAVSIPIAYSRFIEETVFPVFVTIQVVPKVALAPLFLVWLGFGMLPKVMVAALIAFFPVVVNTVKGLRSVEPELVQWMRTLGASGSEIFRKLSLPWATPYIMASLKVAIGSAVVGAVVGEFVGTDRGLGYVLLRSSANVQTELTFAAIVMVSVIGIASYAVMAAVEKVVLSWQESAVAMPDTGA